MLMSMDPCIGLHLAGLLARIPGPDESANPHLLTACDGSPGMVS